MGVDEEYEDQDYIRYFREFKPSEITDEDDEEIPSFWDGVK